MSRAFIPAIADQVADAICGVWRLRSRAVASMNHRLADLAELDERLEAGVDAVRTMGRAGRRRCEMALSLDDPGEMFLAALFALESRDAPRLQSLCATAEAIPETRPGLHTAFCWVEPELLQGIVKELLESESPFRRTVGLTASADHRVHPGAHLMSALRSPVADVRAAAIRVAGELGGADLDGLPEVDDDETCGALRAWSSVLLGDRGRALRQLAVVARTPGSFRKRALELVLRVTPMADAHDTLKALALERDSSRLLITGAGIAGDPAYVPWLIRQMVLPASARLAGEAFALITGADFESNRLEGRRPAAPIAGPTEDATDRNVELDPDDCLPWPDAERVNAWWADNAGRFRAGSRYFMGAPLTCEHCIDVLRQGYQRQRVLAADYLCLLQPGTPLFNTSAPTWRQQRLLEQMK